MISTIVTAWPWFRMFRLSSDNPPFNLRASDHFFTRLQRRMTTSRCASSAALCVRWTPSLIGSAGWTSGRFRCLVASTTNTELKRTKLRNGEIKRERRSNGRFRRATLGGGAQTPTSVRQRLSVAQEQQDHDRYVEGDRQRGARRPDLVHETMEGAAG